MGRAIYSTYDDYVGPTGAIAVQSGTEDPTYPAANLSNRIPSLPAQLVSASGAWIFDFVTAQRVDWVGLLHHNLDAGIEVRIQGNASNSWGSPTLSEAIQIPAYRADGFPAGSWLDLTGATGYSGTGFRYWRLVIVDTNSAAVKIGELALVAVKRVLNPNINWPAKKPESRAIIENTTDYGVSTVYDLGVTRRRWGGMLDVSDGIAATMLDWWRSSRGRARPWAFIPDEDVNEAWLVRFGSNQVDLEQAVLDRNNIPLDLEEVSRGLVL